MHRYLNTIGFSQIKTKKQEEILLHDVIKSPSSTNLVTNPYNSEMYFAEYKKEYAPGIGIRVCGQMDEEDKFFPETYFPYYEGRYETTDAEAYFDKKMNIYDYTGLCNDDRLGVALIFHLINPVDYLSTYNRANKKKYKISGLSLNGIIVLPTCHTERFIRKPDFAKQNKGMIIKITKSDEASNIAKAEFEEMNKYAEIDMRLENKEDVLSIVETSIVPFGMEAEIYKILGIIISVEKVTNPIMGEKLYSMEVMCNNMIFDICINEANLYGEPLEGRRFRGIVWLQGKMEF